MAARDPQAVLQKLGQNSLKVDAFFLRRTGFLSNQTVLRLGEYNLNLVPATIGLVQGRFLAVLSPSEMNLFAKYKEGLHILILSFGSSEKKDITRYPLRVALDGITAVPDRKNVCFVDLRFKSLPSAFVIFLGDFQEELEARQEAWEKLSAQSLTYHPALVLAGGGGFGFVLVWAEGRASVEIQSFHTKLIQLSIPPTAVSPPEGPCQLKMAFQGRPVSLEGVLGPDAVFVPEFHPDWLSFVEECVFQNSLTNRAPGKPTP